MALFFKNVEIEVDLDEFDDEEIEEEFYSRNLNLKLPFADAEERLDEIYIEFENGRQKEAMIMLERLFPRLRGISEKF